MTDINTYLTEEVVVDYADGLVSRREALRRLSLLGMGASHEAGPKFVKRYANLGDTIVEAATAYRRDVEAGTYPDAAHSY